MLKDNPKLLIFLILSAALIISLAANLIILRAAWLNYKDANAVRLNPLGLSFYPTDASRPVEKAPGQKVVVFFGDSRAVQWPFPKGPDMEANFRFINRGLDTQTSSQVAGRFDQHVRPLQPDIIVLQMCINDLKTIPLFPEAEQAIIDGCKNNIREIVAKSRQIDAAIILTTIFPTGPIPPERRLLSPDQVTAAVNEVNTYIQSLAAENVIILDGDTILANENGTLKQQYHLDYLHINAPAYEALNEKLANILLMVE